MQIQNCSFVVFFFVIELHSTSELELVPYISKFLLKCQKLHWDFFLQYLKFICCNHLLIACFQINSTRFPLLVLRIVYLNQMCLGLIKEFFFLSSPLILYLHSHLKRLSQASCLHDVTFTNLILNSKTQVWFGKPMWIGEKFRNKTQGG